VACGCTRHLTPWDGQPHHTEEEPAMSEPKPGTKEGVKTLGIRLPDELHAQFALVAQLDGLSLTDAIRRAVEFYVEAKRSESNFAERASAALDEIEREAAARRAAIQGLFGTTEQDTSAAASTTRNRKSGSAG
jgi:hypothetical protein